MFFLIFSLVMFTNFEYCFLYFRFVFSLTSVVETSYKFCKPISRQEYWKIINEFWLN